MIPESSRLEFLEKFSANNFALSDTEGNTSGPLNRRGIADSSIEHYWQFAKSHESLPIFWEVMDSFVLLEYSSLAAQEPFSNDYFGFRRFILLVQMKKVISMNYGSCTSSWKPWRLVRLDLILTVRDIYINSKLNSLTKFTSSKSTDFKDIFPWNISQKIMKIVPISMRLVISYAMKQGILLWI